MRTKQLNRNDFEAARAEIFHMILFAMAWVMIGEYGLHFKDYAVAAGVVLVAVVILGLRTIRLYDLEDELPDPPAETVTDSRERKKRSKLYVSIFLFEGAAIMATWTVLLHVGHEDWLVPAFALVAGLHFIPLARVIRLNSYYLLAAWICILAVAGHLLPAGGKVTVLTGNTLIAYGCAAGAIADGFWIVASVRKNR
jgi:hypothetical protein